VFLGVGHAPSSGAGHSVPLIVGTPTCAHTVSPRATKFGTIWTIVFLEGQSTPTSQAERPRRSRNFGSSYIAGETATQLCIKWWTSASCERRTILDVTGNSSVVAEMTLRGYRNFLSNRSISQ